MQEVSGFRIGHMLKVPGEGRRMGKVENGSTERAQGFLVVLFLIAGIVAVLGISML